MATPTRTDVLDVLLIDDDAAMANLVSTVLRYSEGQRFSVRHERTAEGGLSSYDGRPADAVVLDLGLPDAPRAQPLHVLRELLSRHPQPCVVVLTGHPWNGLGREAVRMGAQDYIDKQSMSAGSLRDTVLFAVERHAHTTRTAPVQALNDAAEAASHPTQRGGAERLRTPLSTVTRTLEALRSGRKFSSEETTELLDQALRAAYALGGQLDQVVAAQRRLQGREPVDMAQVAARVVTDLADLTEAIGGRIEVDDLPDLWGQREPLRLLLRNLTINALQHCGPGVRVRLSATEHPRGVRLLVDDDGPGIPPADRAALFEAPPDGSHRFGLRASSAVATAHGGRCWIEDSPLGGTRVVVELPVRRRV